MKRYFLFSLVLLTALSSSLALAQSQNDDPVMRALCKRHGVSHSLAELIDLAGGEDQLVEKLVSFRTLESPPFVGIRSERLLLELAAREDVQEVLENDIQSEQYLGLARLIALNIDSVKVDSVRRRLARLALQRANSQSSFCTAASTLKYSSDSEVSRQARAALD